MTTGRDRPAGRGCRAASTPWGVCLVLTAGLLLACGRAESPRETRTQPTSQPPAAPASGEGPPTARGVGAGQSSTVPAREPAPAERRRAEPPAPTGAESPRSRSRATPPAAAVPGSLPKAWVVRSILVGPDRRLALLDGHIVGPGDRLDGQVVEDVAADTVILRDAGGRRRAIRVGPAAKGLVVR